MKITNRRSRYIVCFLAWLPMAEWSLQVTDAQEAQEVKEMDMAKDQLGLESGEYWTNPKRTADDIVGRMLNDNFSGVRIGIPAKVPLDLRETLPLIAIHAGSYKDTWEIPFEKHALLAVMDLDLNLLRADWASDQDLEQVPLNPAEAPEGNTAGVYEIDLRQRIDLPWHEGRYLVTLLLRDKISNRVDVEIARGAYKDEEVEKFVAAERRKDCSPTVFPPPGRSLPTYQPLVGSPKIPGAVGIEMKLDRVVVLDEGAKWVLKGAFRLPALPQEIVRTTPGSNSKEPVPTAIVGITLLATGSDQAAPNMLRLAVPSYEPINRGDNTVTGYFALDLMTRPEIPRIAQTVFLYAFSGRVLSGPVLTGLVPASRLQNKDP